MNGLRVPEYQSERNYLVHNTQVDFDKACSLCRKTANQDVVVAAAAGTSLPAAFYDGSPTATTPPTLTRFPFKAAPATPSTSSPDVVELLSMLTKSVDMVNKQLASQAAAIKSLEDKKVKDNQRPDGNRGKSPYRKPAEQGGMRPPPPTCTYCNKLGHTEKQCFAKRDDAKDVPPKAQCATTFKTAVVPKVVPQLRHEAFMTMASIAEERGGETSKPFSYKSSELVTITEGIEAVQSSVEVVAISKMDDIGKKAELPCLSESSELLSLNAIPDCEFDLSTPVRYLGLCCGASMEIIRSLVLGGRYFAEMYLCDLDPLARRVALDALQQMVSRHPKNFSAPLRQDKVRKSF
jgi:hypothetical protein